MAKEKWELQWEYGPRLEDKHFPNLLCVLACQSLVAGLRIREPCIRGLERALLLESPRLGQVLSEDWSRHPTRQPSVGVLRVTPWKVIPFCLDSKCLSRLSRLVFTNVSRGRRLSGACLCLHYSSRTFFGLQANTLLFSVLGITLVCWASTDMLRIKVRLQPPNVEIITWKTVESLALMWMCWDVDLPEWRVVWWACSWHPCHLWISSVLGEELDADGNHVST